MECAEYFYNENEAKSFTKQLTLEGYEEIRTIRTMDEDADVPCYVWEVTWKPKAM